MHHVFPEAFAAPAKHSTHRMCCMRSTAKLGMETLLFSKAPLKWGMENPVMIVFFKSQIAHTMSWEDHLGINKVSSMGT